MFTENILFGFYAIGRVIVYMERTKSLPMEFQIVIKVSPFVGNRVCSVLKCFQDKKSLE